MTKISVNPTSTQIDRHQSKFTMPTSKDKQEASLNPLANVTATDPPASDTSAANDDSSSEAHREPYEDVTEGSSSADETSSTSDESSSRAYETPITAPTSPAEAGSQEPDVPRWNFHDSQGPAADGNIASTSGSKRKRIGDDDDFETPRKRRHLESQTCDIFYFTSWFKRCGKYNKVVSRREFLRDRSPVPEDIVQVGRKRKFSADVYDEEAPRKKRRSENKTCLIFLTPQPVTRCGKDLTLRIRTEVPRHLSPSHDDLNPGFELPEDFAEDESETAAAEQEAAAEGEGKTEKRDENNDDDTDEDQDDSQQSPTAVAEIEPDGPQNVATDSGTDEDAQSERGLEDAGKAAEGVYHTPSAPESPSALDPIESNSEDQFSAISGDFDTEREPSPAPRFTADVDDAEMDNISSGSEAEQSNSIIQDDEEDIQMAHEQDEAMLEATEEAASSSGDFQDDSTMTDDLPDYEDMEMVEFAPMFPETLQPMAQSTVPHTYNPLVLELARAENSRFEAMDDVELTHEISALRNRPRIAPIDVFTGEYIYTPNDQARDMVVQSIEDCTMDEEAALVEKAALERAPTCDEQDLSQQCPEEESTLADDIIAEALADRAALHEQALQISDLVESLCASSISESEPASTESLQQDNFAINQACATTTIESSTEDTVHVDAATANVAKAAEEDWDAVINSLNEGLGGILRRERKKEEELKRVEKELASGKHKSLKEARKAAHA